MSETTRVDSAPWESERYELASAPVYTFDLDRRDFFKLLGAGVLVFSVLRQTAWSQESGRARGSGGDALPREIDAWLHIGENGKVTVYTGKVEVGQNIRTSLSQGVAEELHVPFEKIDLVMGDTQLTPFDMGTFGSRTTPTMNLQLRKVAAAARNLLIDLSSAQWQTDRQHLVVADGKVLDPKTKRSIE
jgi:isoquinoline 1-oxidoreductase